MIKSRFKGRFPEIRQLFESYKYTLNSENKCLRQRKISFSIQRIFAKSLFILFEATVMKNYSNKASVFWQLESRETTRHETLRNSVVEESLSSHTLSNPILFRICLVFRGLAVSR